MSARRAGAAGCTVSTQYVVFDRDAAHRGSYPDKATANRALRDLAAGSCIISGGVVFSIRYGTTPKQKGLIDKRLRKGRYVVPVETELLEHDSIAEEPEAQREHTAEPLAQMSVDPQPEPIEESVPEKRCSIKNCSESAAPVTSRTQPDMHSLCREHRMREIKRRNNVKRRPAPIAPSTETCAESGCSEPVGRVRRDTWPDTAKFCPKHRKNAKDKAASRARRGKVARPTEKARKRAARPGSLVVVQATPMANAAALVARCLAVVTALGGIERAERIATAIGASE